MMQQDNDSDINKENNMVAFNIRAVGSQNKAVL